MISKLTEVQSTTLSIIKDIALLRVRAERLARTVRWNTDNPEGLKREDVISEGLILVRAGLEMLELSCMKGNDVHKQMSSINEAAGEIEEYFGICDYEVDIE